LHNIPLIDIKIYLFTQKEGEIMDKNTLIKTPTKDVTIAANVTKEFRDEFYKFCDEKNFVKSRFVEMAIRNEMKRCKKSS